MSYAIAVEQTDAWVLTLYNSKLRKHTSVHRNPKEVLNDELQRSRKDHKKLFQRSAFKRYEELTMDFRRLKRLNKCAEKNLSLRRFLDELERWRPSD